MICLIKPCRSSIKEILEQKATAPFSYTDVGLTARGDSVPEGYLVNKYKRYIGRGEVCFTRSVNTIESGAMYRQALSSLSVPEGTQLLSVGLTGLVIAKHFGIWSINPIRIVFKGLRHAEGDKIFSIATGTLKGHMECGEERFSIRHTSMDEVWFEIFSFYKPSQILLRPFYPLIRIVLDKFDKLASEAVIRQS